MLEDQLTLDLLRTFPGMVAVTWTIVQFFKNAGMFKRVRTRFFTLVVAELLLFGLSTVEGRLTVEDAFLNVLNGFVVALAAMKGHETLVEKPKPH